MSTERDRDEDGRFTGRIPAESALEAFDDREDAARPLTADDVMEAIDCSRRTAHDKLNELAAAGTLETRKIGARGRVWWVPIDNAPEPPGNGARSSDRNADAPSNDAERAIREAELPGSGETLATAYEYLTTHPSATKSEFIDEIYPAYPAGFETPEGWWNAVQPALKELPAVGTPAERGHLWQFLGADRFTPTLG